MMFDPSVLCEGSANAADWLTGIGTLLGGFAAAAAVCVASKWRGEQRERRRAEVAGDAIAATIRLVTALRFTSAPAFASLRGGSELPEEIGEARVPVMNECQRRWTVIGPDIEAFERVAGLAVAYLPDVSEVLDQLRQAHMHILESQELWIRSPTGSEESRRYFADGFGPDIWAALETLKNAITSQLGPIARLA